MSIYESIIKGLEEAIEYEKGNFELKTKKLTINPVPEFNSKEVKAIRTNLGMTQAMFAKVMGVSQKTVEAWEHGTNSPNGTARRLLDMLRADPDLPQKYNITA